MKFEPRMAVLFLALLCAPFNGHAQDTSNPPSPVAPAQDTPAPPTVPTAAQDTPTPPSSPAPAPTAPPEQAAPAQPPPATPAPALDQPAPATPLSTTTFTDPLLGNGPDPWVVWWNGFYYYSNSTGTDLTLLKTADITDLRHAQKTVVWAPEPGHAWSSELWAPELHRWDNKWYIYFAADAGKNASHRIYVVENDSDDPTAGAWTLKGKIGDASDKWAIDATTFDVQDKNAKDQHYLVWSGWKGDKDGEQDIYIAHMSDPWTIDSKRTLISKPHYPWEKHGDLPGRHVNVNEGPEFISHGDKMFIVFSASGCWTDNYSLGALEAKITADPLKGRSWKKIDHPFLSTDPAAPAYSPGHNGFFKSPDGQQDWIIYHANPAPGEGCENHRSPRIQQFTWDELGRPNFGKPAPLNQPQAKPTH